MTIGCDRTGIGSYRFSLHKIRGKWAWRRVGFTKTNENLTKRTNQKTRRARRADAKGEKRESVMVKAH